jgi:hypothetical protein
MTVLSAKEASTAQVASPAPAGWLLRMFMPGLVALLLACGLGFRAAPLLNQGGRLLRQFPTEDGYLMLTIARNIAIGKGMSTADGTIPTNGTQPAVTFLWALCYRFAGGDKAWGVALVQVVQIIVSLLAAWVLYQLGQALLGQRPDGKSIAALAAGLWYAAPLTVQHSMNCLETGVYALVILLTLWAYLAAWGCSGAEWSYWQCLGLGALLGLCFWVRNDAVLLVLAACLVRVLSGLTAPGRMLARRVGEAALMGLTTSCIAMPWLIYNKVNFGHIMPISGVAEAMDATFAGNLASLPAKMAEYILVVGAIPSSLERQPLVLAGCLIVIAAFLVWGVYCWRRSHEPVRATMAVFVSFALLLAGFYGLYFGAGHFMGRYLFPLSPLLALTTLAGLAALWHCARQWRWRTTGTCVLAASGLCVLVGLNVRTYLQGKTHMHFQAVEWIAQNVPPDAWVGAIQTGTVGYFHDRTINLDGKVNPEALRARLAPGAPNGIPQYIIDKPIQYIVDWVGVAGWMNLPDLKGRFELVVRDAARGQYGLAVLRRLPENHDGLHEVGERI